MKDSGIEWIGEIPENWDVLKFKYIATSLNKGNGITKEDVANGGDIPCVRYGEIYSKYNEGFTECLSFTTLDRVPNKQFFSYGDILFTCTGELVEEIGKNIVYLGNERCLAGGDIIVATHSQDPSFLNFALNSTYCQQQKSYGKTKLKVVHISADNICNIIVTLPPLSEQQSISAYLDRQCGLIDSVIEKTKASIEEYKKLRQAVITQAVTKGVRGDRPMKDSGSVWFGDIPAEWSAKKLKYQFSIKKDIAGKEGYTVLSITQRGIIPKDLSKNEGQLAESYANYQLVNIGDFAMNHMDLLTGWVDISEYEGVTSPDYRVFVLNDKDNNDSHYYLYMMQMCYSNRIFYGLGQGVSGLGRWRLQADKFLNFVIPVPPQEEQKEIAAYLDKKCAEIDSLISKKEQFLTELESYKKSMIYEYVTGKKEVPQS
jgi:type I restriction enzyme S subunit